MSHGHPPVETGKLPEVTDRSKRDLIKASMGLLLAGSFAAPASRPLLAASVADAGTAVAPWGDPASLVSAIGSGTLAVASAAETIEAYCKGFGYVEHWRGPIPKEAAKLWGVPDMASRTAAVLGAPDFQRGMIRIVELGKDFNPVSFRNTLGWHALEIHVRSPKDVVTQLKGLPFVHTGGPTQAKAPEGNPLYTAAQFTGPSGESLYMTQHMQLDQLISVGRNNIGPLFIQTLNAYPYQATRDFYLETLGLKMRLEVDTRVSEGKSRKMLAVRAPEYCSIQVDEYPQDTPQRPATAGCFAAGVSMCTFTTRNLGPVKSALRKANIRFLETRSNACPPFRGSRAVGFAGRAGERIEVVQIRHA